MHITMIGDMVNISLHYLTTQNKKITYKINNQAFRNIKTLFQLQNSGIVSLKDICYPDSKLRPSKMAIKHY